MEEEVKGFALSGDEVKQLTDKSFTIHAKPYYEEVQDINNADKKIEIMIVPVTLANGVKVEWKANKTSQKVIIAAKGRLLSEWVGYDGIFDIKEQKVGKEDRQVIYLE